MPFELLKTDPSSRARAGILRTEHGDIPTPVFMPVGTQGSVKAVSQRDLLEMDTRILLGNTYHLFLRPGLEAMREFGGLHKFMNWPRPILTDSGGFQVFSLAKLRRLAEDGVHFRCHVSGAPHFLGTREAIAMQVTMGSDVMMVLDECPPWPCEAGAVRDAVERTVRWARDCKGHHAALMESTPDRPTKRQNLFGIVQGGSHEALRRECAERLVEIGFDGYAIGGVSVGEPEDEMMAAVEYAEPFLPADKPRYAMGLGQPHQMIEMVARGVDMFDCVLPTRMARHGTAYTRGGQLHLKNSAYRMDQGPLEAGCACYACTHFTRAYIRHLLRGQEILGLMLVSLHNSHFYLELLREARAAILDGTFEAFRRSFRETYRVKGLATNAGTTPQS
ncbi:MAG: tRNA guanosine(34) transglycosylase Tgt [Verrucomicrobium sp.]|nr:tRNA guanosine(34) transglycosylase Tgt [Verrucomicrobium sp.]